MVKKMKRSSEYNTKGILYVISSPIGNLEDITFRALNTIKEVDYLFSEDTRVTKKLLTHYSIEKKLDSFHDYSDSIKEDFIISLLLNGNSVGIISDAGTPLISDPGYELVVKAKENNIKIVPIPGASASISALVMSALPVKPYLFYGFLDHKESKKKKELEELKNYPFTIIFYESPIRVYETLKDMHSIFGERKCSINREITKLYEESIDFNLSEYASLPTDLKGEMVIVVSGKDTIVDTNIPLDLNKEMKELVNNGYSIKEASKILSSKYNIKSSEIYNDYVKVK